MSQPFLIWAFLLLYLLWGNSHSTKEFGAGGRVGTGVVVYNILFLRSEACVIDITFHNKRPFF
jgi:hypothetical protein